MLTLRHTRLGDATTFHVTTVTIDEENYIRYRRLLTSYQSGVENNFTTLHPFWESPVREPLVHLDVSKATLSPLYLLPISLSKGAFHFFLS
jgi:hypothetical protein